MSSFSRKQTIRPFSKLHAEGRKVCLTLSVLHKHSFLQKIDWFVDWCCTILNLENSKLKSVYVSCCSDASSKMDRLNPMISSISTVKCAIPKKRRSYENMTKEDWDLMTNHLIAADEYLLLITNHYLDDDISLLGMKLYPVFWHGGDISTSWWQLPFKIKGFILKSSGICCKRNIIW